MLGKAASKRGDEAAGIHDPREALVDGTPAQGQCQARREDCAARLPAGAVQGRTAEVIRIRSPLLYRAELQGPAEESMRAGTRDRGGLDLRSGALPCRRAGPWRGRRGQARSARDRDRLVHGQRRGFRGEVVCIWPAGARWSALAGHRPGDRFVRLRGCRGARPQGAALNAAPQVARVLFGASARDDGRSPASA
jgi:hypothetical protein